MNQWAPAVRINIETLALSLGAIKMVDGYIVTDKTSVSPPAPTSISG